VAVVRVEATVRFKLVSAVQMSILSDAVPQVNLPTINARVLPFMLVPLLRESAGAHSGK